MAAPPTVTLSTCNCQFPQSQLSSWRPIAAHVVPFSQSEAAQLALDQSERSWQPFCPEAAGEQRSWWDRERERGGSAERGEDAADDRSGAWLQRRPLPLRHRRDRPPNAQGTQQPRQQQNGKTSEREKKQEFEFQIKEVKVTLKYPHKRPNQRCCQYVGYWRRKKDKNCRKSTREKRD